MKKKLLVLHLFMFAALIGYTKNGITTHKASRIFFNAMPHRGQSAYMQYFASTNCSLSFSETNTLANLALGNPIQCSIQAGDSGNRNIGVFSINDVTVPYDSINGYRLTDIATIQSKSVLLSKYFGTNVTFSCTNTGHTQISQNMYIPTVINLNNIYGGKADQPVKANRSTRLSWNADPQNVNGIVIRVEAFDHSFKQIVNNIGLYPDNGSCTLDNSLFKGIRHGVTFSIEVIRGNIMISKGTDGLTYKFYAYSSCRTSFIM